jgi:hypothetical protein
MQTPTPSSFSAGPAPTYNNSWAGNISDLYNQQVNYGEYNYDLPAPDYTSRYDDTIQDLIRQALERGEFQYDAATDPLYGQYAKTYAREGQRATENALGEAAAATGGIPSSYAAAAAAQAGNYYAAQMADKVPELYQMAYDRYLREFERDLSKLNVVQGAEQMDYGKFLDQQQQYNVDRNFDYSTWLDRYNMLSNNLQTASGLEQLDYQRYLNDLNQYNTDRQFGYGQVVDQYNAMTGQEATDWERQYALAQLAAQYGDYSGLQALGITPSIQTGGSGGGGGGGGGSTPPKEKTGTTEKKFNQIQNINTTPLSASTIQTLTTAYGGKALTKAQWEAILNNNPGITEQALRDAGFYIKDAASTPPGTGGSQYITSYSGAISAMKTAGVPTALANGMMTETEWTRKKQSGSTEDAVADFRTYQEYIQDYVEFAVHRTQSSTR